MQIITMLSDFGERDQYVAQMKGVILNQCPDASIVDISHMVERHNVLEGSFLLETTVPYFPKGSIHLAVVDPGVGSDRLPVAVKTRGGILVGPDNGLLDKTARTLEVVAVHKIEVDRVHFGQASSTFHGRDVFARAVAKLAQGVEIDTLGPKLPGLMPQGYPEGRIRGSKLDCRILHIDNFGNLITNARNSLLAKVAPRGERVSVRGGQKAVSAQVAETYSRVARGRIIVLEGSQGYVEVAARESRADKIIGVVAGDGIEVYPVS